MNHIVSTIFEVSVLTMAFSFVLINKIFEAAAMEPAIVKGKDKKTALTYFILLFISAIVSLSLLLFTANSGDHSESSIIIEILSYAVVLSFVVALCLLVNIVYKMYVVMPYLAKADHDKNVGKLSLEEEVVID